MMIIVATPLASTSDANDSRTNVNDIFLAEFTDREVIVFSDDLFIDEVRSALTSSTSNVYGYASRASVGNAIVLIDELWLAFTSSKQPSADQIEDLLYSGVPLIFIKGNSYLYKDSGIELRNRALPQEDGIIYGLYYGPSGVSYAYSCGGTDSDLPEVLAHAYAWADKAIAEDPEYVKERELSLERGSFWNLEQTVQFSSPCSNKGYLNIYTQYYKLMNFNDGYTYYAIKHSQGVAPDLTTSHRVADIYLNTTLLSGHYLCDTQPASASGTNTCSISFTFSTASPGATVGWSYGISNVKAINTSNSGTSKISIWHDVDETKIVGLGYTAYPGVLLRVANDVNSGSLNITDVYGVQLAKYTDNSFLGIHYATWDFYKYHIDVAAYISN